MFEKYQKTNKENQLKKIIVLILILFLIGNVIAFIGFSKGKDIAVVLSKPYNANAWITPDGVILGCTYVPVIIGISLIILSIIFSAILFANWINMNKNN